MRQNVQLVKVGQFPTYTLTGEWQYSYFADYQRRYGQVYKDVILKYVAYVAYADLSDKKDNLLVLVDTAFGSDSKGTYITFSEAF